MKTLEKIAGKLRNTFFSTAVIASAAISQAQELPENFLQKHSDEKSPASVNLQIETNIRNPEYPEINENRNIILKETSKPYAYYFNPIDSHNEFGEELGLSEEETSNAYSNVRSLISSDDLKHQRNLLNSLEEKLNTNQKIFFAATLGESAYFFYDEERIDNEKYGVVSFKEIANIQKRVYELSILRYNFGEFMDEIPDYNFSGNKYNEETMNRYLIPLLTEVTDKSYDFFEKWIDEYLKEYLEKNEEDAKISDVIDEMRNGIINRDLLGFAAVCRDIAVYQSWQMHELGIKDSFISESYWINEEEGIKHSVAGGRNDDGKIFFLNYGSIFQSDYGDLERAMAQYEQQGIEGIKTFYLVSRGEDEGKEVKRYQTPAGESLEKLVRNAMTLDEFRRTLFKETEDYNYEINIDPEFSTIKRNFDGFFVNAGSFQFQNPLNSIKKGYNIGAGYSKNSEGILADVSMQFAEVELKSGMEQDFALLHLLLGYLWENKTENPNLRGYIFGETLTDYATLSKSSSPFEGLKKRAKSSTFGGVETGAQYNNEIFGLGGFVRAENSREDIRMREKQTMQPSHYGIWGIYNPGQNSIRLDWQREIKIKDIYSAEYGIKPTEEVEFNAEYKQHKTLDPLITTDRIEKSISGEYQITKDIATGIKIEDNGYVEYPVTSLTLKANF